MNYFINIFKEILTTIHEEDFPMSESFIVNKVPKQESLMLGKEYEREKQKISKCSISKFLSKSNKLKEMFTSLKSKKNFLI